MFDFNYKQRFCCLIKGMGIFFYFFVLLLTTVSAKEDSLKFKAATLQSALKEIAVKYNAVVIADPSLDGPVLKEIKTGSVEAALLAILEPLGYSYTKVEDYYLISGPKSPLTLMAQTESSVVPVGFMDQQTREKLGDLQQYLTYDETKGIAYVKAPSSKMNLILAKLWEISQTSGELSVVYRIQIIDMGTSSGLDFMFSGKYDSSSNDKGLILTPDQWASDGTCQAILKAKAETNTNNVTRQPWLITLPGKTTEMTTSLYYRSADIQYERVFKVAVTPEKLDPGSGKVVSKVLIARDLTNQNNQITVSKQKTPVEIAEKTNRVSTSVETKPGKREILAVVRQTNERLNQSAIFQPFLGKRKVTEHRDFLLMITATPVNIQSSLASGNGLIPVASLTGFAKMDEGIEPPVQWKSTLGLGLGVENSDGSVDPWLELQSPLGTHYNLELSYRTEDIYSVGLSYHFDTLTSLKLSAGKGIGPQRKNAAMFGLADMKKPTDFVEFFGEYYPLSYLFDSQEISWQGVWEAGTRLGSSKIGLSVSAYGDSGYDGCRYKIDYSPDKYTWILAYSTLEKEPDFSLGVRFQF